MDAVMKSAVNAGFRIRGLERGRPKSFVGRRLAVVSVFAAVMLAGCANTITTELTTYNDWSAAPAQKTYTFSRPLALRDSLELQSYEGLVKQELDRLGFRQTDPASAKLLVGLRPSVAIYDYSYWSRPDPWFYHHHWRGGWGGYGPYGYPFYGPFGGMDEVSPVYQRQLQLMIDDQSVTPVKRLFEATAVNEGYERSLRDAMPFLVRSIFSDFPGANGQMRKVVIPKK